MPRGEYVPTSQLTFDDPVKTLVRVLASRSRSLAGKGESSKSVWLAAFPEAPGLLQHLAAERTPMPGRFLAAMALHVLRLLSQPTGYQGG